MKMQAKRPALPMMAVCGTVVGRCVCVCVCMYVDFPRKDKSEGRRRLWSVTVKKHRETNVIVVSMLYEQ